MTITIQAKDLQVGMFFGLFNFFRIDAVRQVSNGDVYYKSGNKTVRCNSKQRIRVTMIK